MVDLLVFLMGIIIGVLGTAAYFAYTGSALNWKRKKK